MLCCAQPQGKIQGNEFIVIDAVALPVEGTETRVNAQAEAMEYVIGFLETQEVGAGPFCCTVRRPRGRPSAQG